jgi:hypothetical protein
MAQVERYDLYHIIKTPRRETSRTIKNKNIRELYRGTHELKDYQPNT